MGNVVEITTKKLRSVQQLFQMIRENDPETACTEYMIRKLLYGGSIPTVSCGNKKLACYEDLCAYLFEGRRWQ